MEVGIENCLHIEFEYFRSRYNLRDVVVGKVFFLLVKIRVKHMHITLSKQESTGPRSNPYIEMNTLSQYEIMEGPPVKGESVPIRFFLSAFDLTPTYQNVEEKFSVNYFLNLILIDENDRRYFKQSEINLFRLPPTGLEGMVHTENTPDVDVKRRKRRIKV
eukprot:TRINITY_DN2073_c0_g1_i2.p2 TRINITY_DN2073_c0_g1~~TRINITY_DN2073_c0_g1_i2.p2  ORF type:complete len:161 (-),score=32.84 TRINITY_DN2073_c0_g1_i2:66-548(-)